MAANRAAASVTSTPRCYCASAPPIRVQSPPDCTPASTSPKSPHVLAANALPPKSVSAAAASGPICTLLLLMAACKPAARGGGHGLEQDAAAAAHPTANGGASSSDCTHEAVVARACRKLNRLLLPFALLFSIVASIDRANLSYASVSMSEDLQFSPLDYGLGSAIFFVTYSIFQLPSNIACLYSSGPFILGLIAVSWGIVAASMAAVQSRAGFLTVRFMLGIAEAGTVPGCWAYLAQMYPPTHLTLPTTCYMAGITAAQALGAPLAAGLLSLDGAAGMAGWRWVFVLEGAPAVLLGFAIWLFLPAKVSACRMLSSEEQQHLQAAVSGTIPPAACATNGPPSLAAKGAAGEAGQQTPTTVIKAVTHDDGGRTSSSSSSSGSSSVSGGAAQRAGSSLSEGVLAAGLKQQVQLDGPPSRQQLLTDLAAAASCRVVWCASVWRFLYLLCLNGLVYWVPLLVHAMLEGPDLPHGSSSHSSHNESRVMLLAAVPYLAGVSTHVLNALHSNHAHERRWHIAVPWAIGGAILVMLPVAWMHNAGAVAFALLVLASMGVMGCDGIDVSWICALMSGLTASQSCLALAMINTLANLGGFIGNYLIGALKQATGTYYAAVWMLAAVMLLAAAAVAAFPMRWASSSKIGPDGGARGAASTQHKPAAQDAAVPAEGSGSKATAA